MNCSDQPQLAGGHDNRCRPRSLLTTPPEHTTHLDGVKGGEEGAPSVISFPAFRVLSSLCELLYEFSHDGLSCYNNSRGEKGLLPGRAPTPFVNITLLSPLKRVYSTFLACLLTFPIDFYLLMYSAEQILVVRAYQR